MHMVLLHRVLLVYQAMIRYQTINANMELIMPNMLLGKIAIFFARQAGIRAPSTNEKIIGRRTTAFERGNIERVRVAD